MDWKQLLDRMNERLIGACKTVYSFLVSLQLVQAFLHYRINSIQHMQCWVLIMCLESYYSSYVSICSVTF